MSIASSSTVEGQRVKLRILALHVVSMMRLKEGSERGYKAALRTSPRQLHAVVPVVHCHDEMHYRTDSGTTTQQDPPRARPFQETVPSKARV